MNKPEAINLVSEEVDRAIDLHGEFKSHEEALGVVMVELYELVKGIHEHDEENIKEELTQCAAVFIKWMMLQDTKKK